jgi:hypothetical protein
LDYNYILAEVVVVLVYSIPEHQYKYNCLVVLVGLVAWEGYNCLTEGMFEAVVVSHTLVEVVTMRGLLHYFVV